MDYNKIDSLLEKYFNGLTTIADEKELTSYFSKPNRAPHLEQYASIFKYYKQTKTEKYVQEIPLRSLNLSYKNKKVAWFSIAATVLILLGLLAFMFSNFESKPTGNLGTFSDPKTAYFETQKQLAQMSKHINTGIASINYLNEFEQSKNLIFKK